MKRLVSFVALVGLGAATAPVFAGAEPCAFGGVPGLSRVAQRLGVRPVEASRSALNACDGRAYEIGALLGAAVDRIDRAESRVKKLEEDKR